MTGYRINTVCAGAALTVFLLSGCAQRRAEIADMRCEYMSSPIGIGANTPPRFTWNYTGDDDFVQQRCRVRVASTKAALADSLADGDVWSSPEIVSVNGFAQYDAPQPLEPRTRYYWNAVAWGDDGRIVVSPVDICLIYGLSE